VPSAVVVLSSAVRPFHHVCRWLSYRVVAACLDILRICALTKVSSSFLSRVWQDLQCPGRVCNPGTHVLCSRTYRAAAPNWYRFAIQVVNLGLPCRAGDHAVHPRASGRFARRSLTILERLFNRLTRRAGLQRLGSKSCRSKSATALALAAGSVRMLANSAAHITMPPAR